MFRSYEFNTIIILGRGSEGTTSTREEKNSSSKIYCHAEYEKSGKILRYHKSTPTDLTTNSGYNIHPFAKPIKNCK